MKIVEAVILKGKNDTFIGIQPYTGDLKYILIDRFKSKTVPYPGQIYYVKIIEKKRNYYVGVIV